MNKNDIKITLTTNPKEKPAAETLLFGQTFTDHMFTMEYSPEKGWHDPQIVPYGPFMMDPATMVLHYSQSVFEGMKAYKTPEGKIVLFRPDMNFKRLNLSDERLCIPEIDVDFAITALKELIKVDQDWIPTAPGTSLYIRPFTMGMDKSLGVTPSSHCKFAIILSPVGPYYKEGINPVKIYVEDEYVRAVKGGIGATKATANYAASLKGQQKAMQMGYSQVLWLDGIERKYVEEVGAMNVFFKINGELITPSLEGSILSGVTRDSVMQIARNMGVKVTERKLSIQEIFDAADNGTLEEAFGSGTAAVITPIGLLTWNGRSITIANGENGEFSMKVYKELTGIQNGILEDKFGWVVPVE
jgi:branched-chain amino acid aminotransferase